MLTEKQVWSRCSHTENHTLTSEQPCVCPAVSLYRCVDLQVCVSVSRCVYLQQLHASRWEVSLLSVLQASEPAGLVVLNQNLDQVSWFQVQFPGPTRPILVGHHRHLMDRITTESEPDVTEWSFSSFVSDFLSDLIPIIDLINFHLSATFHLKNIQEAAKAQRSEFVPSSVTVMSSPPRINLLSRL